MIKLRDSFINYLTLFSSTGTLICCALPSLLVSLGLGAVMAGLASSVPGLIWLSEHKIGVFIFSGLMLAVNGILIWTSRNASCPIDPDLRDACIKGRKYSRNIFLVSLGVLTIGFFFAFIAPKIF